MPRPVPVIHLNSDTLCSSKIVAVSEPAPAERVVQYLIHDRLTFLLPQGSLGVQHRHLLEANVGPVGFLSPHWTDSTPPDNFATAVCRAGAN